LKIYYRNGCYLAAVLYLNGLQKVIILLSFLLYRDSLSKVAYLHSKLINCIRFAPHHSHMRPLSILTFFLVALSSCQNSQTKNHKKGSAILSNVTAVAIDTIHINKVVRLKNSPIQLLKEGLYHDGETNLGLSKKRWQGLFVNKNNCYLADAKIKTNRSFDGMVDQPGEKTGLLVKVNHKDTCKLLILGIPLRNVPVKRLNLSSVQILPGEKLNFEHNGKSYCLYAKGNKKIIDSLSYDVSAYQLFVETTQNGHHYIQLLVDNPHYEGAFHTSVNFIGDIDNDGVLDFIIDTSNYYGSENATLYLSSPSKSKAVYTIVAEISATA
jgi:hypothetical protein